MTLSDHSNSSLRISDADRDRAVAALREHVAAGRLSMDEFNERIADVLAARTSGDLSHALRDLPPVGRDSAPTPTPDPSRRRRMRYALWRFATVNGTCIGIWAATGAHSFWPAYVLIGTGAITLRRVFAPPPMHGHRHRTHEQHPAATQPVRRQVMSVLFVDIVDSTKRASAAGDAAWRRLADRYEAQATAAVQGCGGTLLFTKGDEIVAGFDSPAAAVTCGESIRDQAQTLGLLVRAGVHAGEVDRIGVRAEGIAMHIGRRICEAAAAGQLLVSSTIRDLLVGSGRSFTDAGEHELKGLDGAWRLYQPAP